MTVAVVGKVCGLQSRLAFWPMIGAFAAVLTVILWTIDLSGFVGPGTWIVLLPKARWSLIAISLVASAAMLFSRRTTISPPLVWCLLGCAALFPSVVLSEGIAFSTAQYLRLISVVILAAALSTQPAAARSSLIWIYYVLAAICVLSILAEMFGTRPLADVMMYVRARMVGITNHPNALGQVASIVTIIAVFNATEWGKPAGRLWLNVGVAAIGFYCLWQSDSRASRLFVLLSVAIVMGLRLLPIRSSGTTKLVLWSGVAAIIAAIQAIPIFLVLTGIPLNDAARSSAYDASNAERVSVWGRALEYFQLSPWDGRGFGLPLALGRYRWDGTEVSLDYVHNLLLQSLYASGLTGIIFFGCFFWALMMTIWAVLNHPSAGPAQSIRLVGLAVALYLFLASSLDGPLQGLWFTHLIFFLGLTVAYGWPTPRVPGR